VGHKADPDKQEAFVERFWELESVLNEDAGIYFLDGVHPTHNVLPHYQWIKKGEEKIVPANTGRQRVNINGAVNGRSPEQVIIHECERVNAESTIALCEKIRAHQPKGLKVLITDNAGYYRSKAFGDWVEKQDDFLQVFLPSYSPNLNIIERLWGLMKEKVCTQFYAHFSDFRKALHEFFESLSEQGDTLRKLLTLKFEILPKPVSE
jgi:transposase